MRRVNGFERPLIKIPKGENIVIDSHSYILIGNIILPLYILDLSTEYCQYAETILYYEKGFRGDVDVVENLYRRLGFLT